MKQKVKKSESPSVMVDISEVVRSQSEKKNKQVVTLYLEREPYMELQKECGRKVSGVVNQLIKAYLSAKKGT